MATRTTETTVTFVHPFTLSSVDGIQPPGTYCLTTDEEQLPGLSFDAFRRLATLLHLPADPSRTAHVTSCRSIPRSLPRRWRPTPPSRYRLLAGRRAPSPDCAPPAPSAHDDGTTEIKFAWPVS